MRLEGAAALVTGGASGLGAATAQALHERGALVVIADLPQAQERVDADRFTFVAADVRDPDQVTAAVRAGRRRGSAARPGQLRRGRSSGAGAAQGRADGAGDRSPPRSRSI